MEIRIIPKNEGITRGWRTRNLNKQYNPYTDNSKGSLVSSGTVTKKTQFINRSKTIKTETKDLYQDVQR